MKHQDMVDLKMDAPVEIRGSFRPIRTNVPGIEICEHMPRLAKMMDKFAIIRSLYGCPDQHASDLCLSGYPIGAKGRQDNHRTPRINNGGGRDHWPQVSCALRAGGGMRMGQVIGSTNRLGEVPQDRPIHYQESLPHFTANSVSTLPRPRSPTTADGLSIYWNTSTRSASWCKPT